MRPATTPQLPRRGFSPDGRLLAAGDQDGEISNWRVRDGRRVRTLDGGEWQVSALAFSPDGTFLVSGELEEGQIVALERRHIDPSVQRASKNGGGRSLRSRREGVVSTSADGDVRI